MANLADRLRECRSKTNVTQDIVSHAVGIAYSTYCRYERGLNEPTLSDAARLADYFGVSLDYLAGRSDEP